MKRWRIKERPEPSHLQRLQTELGVEFIPAALLLQRGLTDTEQIEQFLQPKMTNLHDPFHMKGMHGAVKRLSEAVQRKEHILLLGDYDVDGTTAVTLMYTFLKQHTTALEYYIPDRYSEGYGVSEQSIDYSVEKKVKLIISLDCGIRSVNEVKKARQAGIDFVVCDHHEPGETLPECIVLDPKQADCPYPFKELSGCGVAFKLLHALCIQNNWSTAFLFEQLDLLAVSIGADIVPVLGENRTLCSLGMKQLNAEPRLAFRKLVESAGRSFPLTLTDVVFTIAPRINAAGRLRSGRFAVQLMVETDDNLANEIAHDIERDNQERRKLDSHITQEALTMLERDESFLTKKSTVVYHPDWHKGVVGIVASRLIEHHFKPTVVLTESNGVVTGSARTVHDFNLHAALTECADLLEKFGGHTHAAGLSLQPENVVPFQLRFEQIVAERISIEEQTPEQVIDMELSFGSMFLPGERYDTVPRLKRILEQFEPFGPGNMKPVFLATNVFCRECRVLKNAHIRASFFQPVGNVTLAGIAFNQADKEQLLRSGAPVDIVYTLEINRWNEKETLQLNVKDIREHNGLQYH
jgi:single-stranded-DNA-specific exonuclease